MSKNFLESDEVKKQMGLVDLLKKIWPFLYAHKKQLYLIFIAVVLFSALGRAIPLIFGYAIDEGIKKNLISVVYVVAAVYLTLEILRSALSFTLDYSMLRLANRILFEIRERVMRHVQNLPITFFDKNPVGRTVTRVTNDIVSLGDLFNQGFTAIFINVIEIISILIALFVLSTPLTVVILLIAPLSVWFTLGISRKLRGHFQDAKKKISKINSFTSESLNGMKILQLYNRGDVSRKKFAQLSNDYKDSQLGAVKQFALLWPVFGFFRMGSVATTLLFGALFYKKLGLTIGEFSAFLLLVQSFFQPIRTILERYNQFQNALASADRIFTLLANKQEPLSGRPLATGRLKGHIEFKNLSFRYDKNAPYVLKDINLSIEPGQSVAIVGRTGSGKTSLISLLQKLYLYDEGEILIDHSSIKDLAPRVLRERLGVIQQDNFIFRGTLESNINLDNESITKAQVLEAAEKANCQHLIERHEGGLGAEVEERGANLSVGEKQLISFARALAFDPDILILDEATANIDSENELHIQKALLAATKDRTSLIIAHRLSTVLNSDLIVVMSEGRIIEKGRHQELMSLKGQYWELYQSQFKHTENHEGLNQ